MTPHARVYFKHFGYQIPEDVPCEYCRVIIGQWTRAVDIHHINGRGKNGNTHENLMALCRGHHVYAHAGKHSAMQAIHDIYLFKHEHYQTNPL